MVRKKGRPNIMAMLDGVDEALEQRDVESQDKKPIEQENENLAPLEQKNEPKNEVKDIDKKKADEKRTKKVSDKEKNVETDIGDQGEDEQPPKELTDFIKNYTENYLQERLKEVLTPKPHRQKYTDTHTRKGVYVRKDNIKRIDKFKKVTGFDDSSTVNMALDILFYLAEKNIDLFSMTKKKK